MTVFEAARGADCIAAAEHLGLEVKRTGRRALVRCLFHADNHPSMTLYPGAGGFYCFSCQAHGDAIKLYQQALGVTPLEAAKRVCADFGLAYDGRASPPPKRADARVLRKKILEYREKRIRALTEKRAQLAMQMAAREDEMYRENKPFDEWWDDPVWLSAKLAHDECQEMIARLDVMQLTELWQEWQETKEEYDDGMGRTE